MLFPDYFPMKEKVPFHLESRFRGDAGESVLVESERDPAGRTEGVLWLFALHFPRGSGC